MTSKLERARWALKGLELQGVQALDCEYPCMDHLRKTVYQDEEIEIKVCYCDKYVEILGLTDSEFEKLTNYEGGLRYIKEEI